MNYSYLCTCLQAFFKMWGDTLGSIIRTHVLPFCQVGSVFCQINIQWINLLPLLSRYVFKSSSWLCTFSWEEWAAAGNTLTKAIRVVAMATRQQTFKCLPVVRHKAQYLRWNFSLILTVPYFDKKFYYWNMKTLAII